MDFLFRETNAVMQQTVQLLEEVVREAIFLIHSDACWVPLQGNMDLARPSYSPTKPKIHTWTHTRMGQCVQT